MKWVKRHVYILVSVYGLLSYLPWLMLMYSNGQMPYYYHDFIQIISLPFLPIYGIDYLFIIWIWGTLNIFEAETIFDLLTDFAIFTVLSTGILIGVTKLVNVVGGRRGVQPR